jgi:hypothetical protein
MKSCGKAGGLIQINPERYESVISLPTGVAGNNGTQNIFTFKRKRFVSLQIGVTFRTSRRLRRLA